MTTKKKQTEESTNPAEQVEAIPIYTPEELLADAAKRAHLISAMRTNRAKYMEKQEAKARKRTAKEQKEVETELAEGLGETSL